MIPKATTEEFTALYEDIREHGLLEPIVTYEGKILDGRTRYNACMQAEIEPKFVEWDGRGDSPLNFVLSENLHRRHLTPSQKAAITLEYKRLISKEQGKPALKEAGSKGGKASGEARRPKPFASLQNASRRVREAERKYNRDANTARRTGEKPPSRKAVNATVAAAQKAGVSSRYVSEVEAIYKARPELVDQIREGKMTVQEAKRQIAPPKVESSIDKAEKMFKLAKNTLGSEGLKHLTKKLNEHLGWIAKEAYEIEDK